MTKRKGLGSSVASHTREANRATVEIERAAALTVNKARNGRCTAATLAYADMQRAIGAYEAHTQAGAKLVWKPQTAIRDAALAYNDRCVREDSSGVGGARRRKSRR